MRTPSVLLAAESVAPTNSGIGRVTRLMARVLEAERAEQRLSARMLSLSDRRAPADSELPCVVAGGSRARFVFEANRARARCDHFLYDFLGMSRAHLPLPFLRRPFLTWIHGIEVWENGRAARLQAAHRATRLLVNTAYTRDRAARTDPVFGEAQVCWLATETDEPGPPRPEPGRPTVLILARIDAGGGYKGHRELVECWPQVVQAVPDARLVIAGTGPGMADIQALAAASRVADSIELRGFVDETELDALWAEASVFAMPSRGEGFGIVYAEAMRRGVPVIASVHDAASEVNADGVSGCNVDLDRPAELPDRIVALLRDADWAARLGAGGRDRWRQHFSLAAFRKRFTPELREFLRL